MMIVMRLFNRRSNVGGTQHRENERLKQCYQQFQRHHKQGERNRSGDTSQ